LRTPCDPRQSNGHQAGRNQWGGSARM
jgi:hypothetical protein